MYAAAAADFAAEECPISDFKETKVTIIRNTLGRIWTDLKENKAFLIAFGIYYLITHTLLHAFCPLVLVTGFPCAGCGMTRAVFTFLTGQFARSIQLNIMALPVILFGIYCFYMRYVRGRKIPYRNTLLLIIGIGLLAVYLWGMITIFPNRPPYTYTRGSLFEKIIPHYREILHLMLGI